MSSPRKRQLHAKRIVSSSPEPEPPAKRRKTATIKPEPVEHSLSASDAESESGSESESEHDSDTESEAASTQTEDAPATNEYAVDEAEVEDLRLPTPPRRTGPSKAELKKKHLSDYSEQRNRKLVKNEGEPIPFPNLVKQEERTDDETGHENSSSESDGDTEGEKEPTNAAEEEDERGSSSDSDDDALGDRSELYRSLEDFYEGIVKLCFNPDLPVQEGEELRAYRDARLKLKNHIEAFARPSSTWIAPFRYTLDMRPNLEGPTASAYPPESFGCDVCWLRGLQACSNTGRMHVLSTAPGIYDPYTFQDLPERGLEYGMQAVPDMLQDKQSRTEAPKVLYPPDYRLVIGERCADRAKRFHQIQHRLYRFARRIRCAVEKLREEYPEYNEALMLKTLEEDKLLDELWSELSYDRDYWQDFPP